MFFTFLAVIGATVIYMGIGMLWYSIFGSFWAKAYDLDMSTLETRPVDMAAAIVVALLVSCGLTYFITATASNTLIDGMRIGFLTWLFLIVPTQFSEVIWRKRPLRGYVIDIVCFAVTLVVMGGFIGVLV
ncbi:MAG: hypothetical protein Tsb0021_06110 [Chlamydiales bacterium]